MKRSIATRLIYILVICGFLMPGCLHQAVKSEQTAATQSPKKKTVETPPTVQPDQKKAESLGVVGGQGAQNAEGQPASKGQSKYQARKEKVAQFKADYEKSADKLAFLLANLDSPDDMLLVEVARLLGRFDDPRSIEALKKLADHNAREDAPWSVAQIAGSSLEWLAAAPDMQKLRPDMPSNMIENLIVKYGNNGAARGHIYTMLRREVENNPEKYVPLIIEYYNHLPQTAELAKQYPVIADKGLEKCLAGTSAYTVGSCMVLIGETGNAKYLETINAVAFYNNGNINYGDAQSAYILRDRAFTAYYYLKVDSLPYLEKVLYSHYDDDKLKAISRLVANREFFGKDKVIAVLRKYCTFMTTLSKRNEAVLNDVCKTVEVLEQEMK